ncbi:MAG: helix-turn-helix domain-containing protein [Bacteroidota bacterium]
MHPHAELANYLSFISRQYHLQLCLNDFAGFVPSDRELDRALRPFMAHTNPYCMYVKSSRLLYDRCLAMKKKIAEKSIKTEAVFYGVCHAGVGEYIIPIRCRGELVGVINAGVFRNDDWLGSRAIERLCRVSGLDAGQARERYARSLTAAKPDLETATDILGIAAAYLGNTCLNLASSQSGLKLGKRRYHSSEDEILAQVLEYIKENYQESVTVAEMARLCHCSESHLSHVFKRRIGANIKGYLNRLRVEQAKQRLTGSGAGIVEIALDVGFADPNYFSRVFARLTGIPPSEYRRRYS